MTIVAFVRHARSLANATGVLAGRTAVGLDEAGMAQAEDLRARLQGVRFDAVVCSPLRRCLETARLAGLEAQVDERFTECDYGEWTNRPIAELAKTPLWELGQRDPAAMRLPGGESMLEMRDRMVAGVEDWVQRHPGGLIAIVSHADPIKSALSVALGQPFDKFQRLVVDPASVSLVDYATKRVLGVNVRAGSLTAWMGDSGAAPR